MQSHGVPQCDSPSAGKHLSQLQIFQMELEVLLIGSSKECFELVGYQESVPCFSHNHSRCPYEADCDSVLGLRILSVEGCGTVGCTSA